MMCLESIFKMMCLESVITRLGSIQCCKCVEMMGLIGAGNNPMVGMTVAVAVAVEESCK